MILAELQLNVEVWRLVKLAIALMQPVLVLLVIFGVILATGHLLTMIGTRWGDHRTSSKSMFFSVAMHLLMVVSIIALIPEYRAIELLNMAVRELEPIRVTVPAGNVEDPEHNTNEPPEFDVTSTTFGPVPSASTAERERMLTNPPEVSPSTPLEKPADPVAFQQQLSQDRQQPTEMTPQTPQQAVPESMLVERSEPQAGPEVKIESLPQQSRPGEGKLSQMERSALPSSPAENSQSLNRPESGLADQAMAELSRDRQSTDVMVMPTETAPVRNPKDSMTSRSDRPAPIGPTPQMLGQQATVETPVTPDPQRGRMEMQAVPPVGDLAGIGRMKPRTSDLPEPIPFPNRAPTSPDRGMLPATPADEPQLSRAENAFQPQMSGNRVPSAYRLRSDEERGKAVLKFGGSQETEDAVDRSLRWMASVQDQAGYWHAGEYGPEGLSQLDVGDSDRHADVGITSLAVLAFLGKLQTVDQGEFSPNVSRALRWIVSQQSTRQWGEGWGSTPGYLGGDATEYEAMYCHAMATFALAEAYAMSRNSPDAQWLRQPLELAVGFILDTQNVDGGWRYVKGQREGDMSIFGWQLMALKSAQAAGIHIEERRIAMMRRFLLERRIGSSGGLAGYRPREAAGASAAAETLYCRQILGMTDDAAVIQENVKVIVANLPRKTTLNYYYWYYGTLALYQHGGPEWEQWNTAVRNMLVADQRREGPLTGSWDPHDVWGGYGGRMYSTAIATLSLEVYYRYLPLYRFNEPIK